MTRSTYVAAVALGLVLVLLVTSVERITGSRFADYTVRTETLRPRGVAIILAAPGHSRGLKDAMLAAKRGVGDRSGGMAGVAPTATLRVVLVGYSFGADVLPFLINRLPPDVRQFLISFATMAERSGGAGPCDRAGAGSVGGGAAFAPMTIRRAVRP